MNRHQLEILCAVAEHQSFSKAAAELYLTQSPVSMQIKQLEEELEIPLLDSFLIKSPRR